MIRVLSALTQRIPIARPIPTRLTVKLTQQAFYATYPQGQDLTVQITSRFPGFLQPMVSTYLARHHALPEHGHIATRVVVTNSDHYFLSVLGPQEKDWHPYQPAIDKILHLAGFEGQSFA
jgi:hypothetical protein